MILKAAVKLSLFYLACGLLWIFLSDKVIFTLFGQSGEQLATAQTYKGFFFIGITAILLYFLATRFYREIDHKIRSLKIVNKALEESEKRYTDLFRLSPMPMWVYDLDTLRFLAVNDAAVNIYRYTREEFLDMSLPDIRPKEEIPRLIDTVMTNSGEGQFVMRGVFTHKKKTGELMQVEIRSNEIQFKGGHAKVVLANDITERLQYVEAIEQQNEKLQHIAWMQSHVVRAPLARMMGLINLLRETKDPTDHDELLKSVFESATEFDAIIKDISDNTRSVKPGANAPLT